MLTLYRNTGESIRIFNEKTKSETYLTLLSYKYPTCKLQVGDELVIKKVPQSIELETEECVITILSIDRGVKFGLVAPGYVKINRVKSAWKV